MGQPYVGEIRMVGFNFAPQGWALCDGSLMSISQNPTLFTLIGTTYGGDGQSTFGLPNLLGRVAVHQGTGQLGASFVMGQLSGTETETVTTNQMPAHSHTPQVAAADVTSPVGAYFASSSRATVNLYGTSNTGLTSLNAAAIESAGSTQPHDNLQPFLAINFVIALFGIFPSQN